MTWFNESRMQRLDPLGLLPLAAGVEGFFNSALGRSVPSGPRADVLADDESVEVRMELPGYQAEHLKIDLEGRSLWIEGELPAAGEDEAPRGRFRRGFRMPFPIAGESGAEGSEPSVEARLVDGILEVKLRRAEADKPRRISVNASVAHA